MPPDAATAGAGPLPSRAELLAVLLGELHAVNGEISAELPTDQALGEELGIDSLDILEFVARIEYRYRVLVPDDDLEGLRTLDDVAGYMLGRLGDG